MVASLKARTCKTVTCARSVTNKPAIDKTVAAIVAQFTLKNADNLFAGRGRKPVDATKPAKSYFDFDLMTWLVIK